jgi:cardiolipin synthase
MFTIPNLLSLLRLVLIVPFIALAEDGNDWPALTVLAIASITDYLDGKAARLLKQESKLGAMLDPAIDRLFIAASIYVLWQRGIFPLWLVGALLLRDFLLLILNIALKRNGLALLAVNFIGKAATFNLLYAFPMLFLSQREGALGYLGYLLGWAFSAWGISLYLITGAWYLRDGLHDLTNAKKDTRFRNQLP